MSDHGQNDEYYASMARSYQPKTEVQYRTRTEYVTVYKDRIVHVAATEKEKQELVTLKLQIKQEQLVLSKEKLEHIKHMQHEQALLKTLKREVKETTQLKTQANQDLDNVKEELTKLKERFAILSPLTSKLQKQANSLKSESQIQTQQLEKSKKNMALF